GQFRAVKSRQEYASKKSIGFLPCSNPESSASSAGGSGERLGMRRLGVCAREMAGEITSNTDSNVTAEYFITVPLPSSADKSDENKHILQLVQGILVLGRHCEY